MATSPLWNLKNPAKPVASFDANAIRVIPVTVDAWLASMGTTYGGHSVIAPLPLQCVSSAYSLGVVSVRMRVDPSAVPVIGEKYPLTLRVVGTDGQQDDMTLWLKIVEA